MVEHGDDWHREIGEAADEVISFMTPECSDEEQKVVLLVAYYKLCNGEKMSYLEIADETKDFAYEVMKGYYDIYL